MISDSMRSRSPICRRDWARRETLTQRIGNAWVENARDTLPVVPSVIVPIATAPDRNVLINHGHADAARIRILDAMPFALDLRLLRP